MIIRQEDTVGAEISGTGTSGSVGLNCETNIIRIRNLATTPGQEPASAVGQLTQGEFHQNTSHTSEAIG